MSSFLIKLLFTLLLLQACILHATPLMKINRVIVSSDTHDSYLPFWPLVAQAWKKIVGIKPTLILVASDDTYVDETIGDVVRFEPIPGIPTALQAQVIRIFMPALFEDDVSIISDMDMIPLCRDYFIKSVENCPEDAFIAYRDNAYKNRARFPMCYVAAKGSTFKEIFGIKTVDDMRSMIIDWYGHHLGCATDELMMYKYVVSWREYRRRCIQLGHRVTRRVDRIDWRYDPVKLKQGEYIDAHLLRPYKEHKKEIDTLATLLGLSPYVHVEETIKKHINDFVCGNRGVDCERMVAEQLFGITKLAFIAPDKEAPNISMRVRLITLYDDIYWTLRRTAKTVYTFLKAGIS